LDKVICQDCDGESKIRCSYCEEHFCEECWENHLEHCGKQD
jgi:hypothetical protein